MRVLKYFLLSLIETKNDGNGMITVIKRVSREKHNLGTKGKSSKFPSKTVLRISGAGIRPLLTKNAAKGVLFSR